VAGRNRHAGILIDKDRRSTTYIAMATYSSYENTKGLIRDFFLKGTNLNTVPLRKIKRVPYLLNGRSRKVFNWNTPYEAFENLAGVALET